jgi:hypothetical protein
VVGGDRKMDAGQIVHIGAGVRLPPAHQSVQDELVKACTLAYYGLGEEQEEARLACSQAIARAQGMNENYEAASLAGLVLRVPRLLGTGA